MLLDVIIGRDSVTRQLRVTSTDGKINQAIGAANSVPLNVSRRHLQLTVEDDGSTCTIKNLNDANTTLVSGQPVVSKRIAMGDLVELGDDHYRLDWNAIKSLIPKTVNIAPLQQVWNEYKRRDMIMSNRQRKDNLLARVPMVFTMIGGALSVVMPEARIMSLPLTVLAAIIMVWGIYRQTSYNPKEEQESLRKWFQQRYTCPECGHFMGFQDYEILTQNPACPYCRTKYKK